ncbi:MAG TPA: EAL domain-containing protein [Casimicrobiaceae bacterium]|jgi:diguanylate cyclase (GGDEF)-like protein/PAS domain S-box-containing protein|nr:EAL domain-containing protein [Casimicrobiaceae bacterium]
MKFDARRFLGLLPRSAHASLATRTSTVTSLLFLAAILAVGGASLVNFRTQHLSVMIEQQDTLVDRIADDLDQKLIALQRVMQLSANEITEADVASPEAAQHYLESNTGLFAAVDRSTFLFTSKGILLAERPDHGRHGGDASWRPYIRDTIRTREPVISEPFVSNVGDSNMVVVLTMPVFAKDGRMIAILTGSLGLTHPNMLGSIAKTTIGKTGYLYITTRDGKLIMHPDRSRLGQVAYAPGRNAFFDKALGGFEATEESLDPDGRTALISYQQVPSTKWVVGAAHSMDEVFQPVNDLIWRFVALLLVACLLVVVAIWILTRYTMRPLVSLTRHITNYDATDEIAPLKGQKGSGEIRALTSAFNRLTSTLHEREDALVEAMQQHQLITENSTDLITKHETSGAIAYASPVSASVLGLDHIALLGHSLFELVHPEDYDVVRGAFAQAEQANGLPTVIYRVRHADQHYVWFETTMRLMKDSAGEEMRKILCISRDISERKRMERRLHELARTDHLTALPNRFLLDERFAGGSAQSRREGSMLAMLMIDIDRFKNINDSLGHGMGDALLKLVGTKLKSCIRDCDTLARWGGDEFVLLLPGLLDSSTAVTVAQRCLAMLKDPFVIEGQTLHITASIGISVSQDASAESETLLKDADTAMYRAKARGGNCHVLYSAEMSAGARSRLSLENALFHAIDRDQLLLHYQPMISARTGRVSGVEALVRWQHPDHGLIPPGQFIPMAEETGLIAAIGEWVLHTACAQMRRWYRQGLPRMSVSVNLSSRQFRQDGLAKTVRAALDASGLDPRLLELELTESVLMDDPARSKAILDELNGLGVSVALDDFGTGYSSLSYLKGFKLDALKIDRTFTAEITTSEATASIVRATIALARGLHLRTVGEGVETRAQAEFLVKHGCDSLQGFLFARPKEPADFLSFAMASHTYLFSRAMSEEAERIG